MNSEQEIMELLINKLDKLDVKLDKLDERVDNIDVTLARQEVQLAIHIKRTEMLEGKLEPVENHVKYVAGALKLLGILATLGGLLKLVHLI